MTQNRKPAAAPLVPLSVQARKAIVEANKRIETNTRPYSIRRKLAERDLTQARLAFRDGNYVKAALLADLVALGR